MGIRYLMNKILGLTIVGGGSTMVENVKGSVEPVLARKVSAGSLPFCVLCDNHITIIKSIVPALWIAPFKVTLAIYASLLKAKIGITETTFSVLMFVMVIVTGLNAIVHVGMVQTNVWTGLVLTPFLQIVARRLSQKIDFLSQ
jgi:hypothetical protein